MRMRHLVVAISLAMLVGSGVAWAMPDSLMPAPAGDRDWVDGEKAVKAERYADAIPLLERFLRRQPQNADALNLLGFSYRKMGNVAGGLEYYMKALALKPDHLGANEYLGELYLEMGDLPKAEERLALLAKLCPTGCEAREDPEAAVKKFKAKTS
jgi:Flp pilus assembly protein TadD